MTARRILVTGGAGFIGSNLADRLLHQNHDVTLFDNMSRPGCENNISWLRRVHGERSFRLIQADLTDALALVHAAERAERIYHLAGQVAVTTSVRDPRSDFAANALGTFNVLEAARAVGDDTILIYASTNKVYGGMEDVAIAEYPTRYDYRDLAAGVSEIQPLDFHSPYGCSKGAGDQYVRDYHRIYGLRTVVARQSCIYGYRQFGIEDQGWLAWFTIAALKGRPITIYGDGKQVRDVLFIDDLLDAYDAFVDHIDVAAGEVFNIGGGRENTLSIWCEFAPRLEEILEHTIPMTYAAPRPGDQRVYITDQRKADEILAWRPRIGIDDGIRRMADWIRTNQSLFGHI